MPEDIRSLFPDVLAIVRRHVPDATRDTPIRSEHYNARIDVAMECQERFGIELDSADLDPPRTVGELIDAVARKF